MNVKQATAKKQVKKEIINASLLYKRLGKPEFTECRFYRPTPDGKYLVKEITKSNERGFYAVKTQLGDVRKQFLMQTSDEIIQVSPLPESSEVESTAEVEPAKKAAKKAETTTAEKIQKAIGHLIGDLPTDERINLKAELIRTLIYDNEIPSHQKHELAVLMAQSAFESLTHEKATAVKAETNGKAATAVKAETNEKAATAVKAETNEKAATAVKAETNEKATKAAKAETNGKAATAVKAETNGKATKTSSDKPAKKFDANQKLAELTELAEKVSLSSASEVASELGKTASTIAAEMAGYKLIKASAGIEKRFLEEKINWSLIREVGRFVFKGKKANLALATQVLQKKITIDQAKAQLSS